MVKMVNFLFLYFAKIKNICTFSTMYNERKSQSSITETMGPEIELQNQLLLILHYFPVGSFIPTIGQLWQGKTLSKKEY